MEKNNKLISPVLTLMFNEIGVTDNADLMRCNIFAIEIEVRMRTKVPTIAELKETSAYNGVHYDVPFTDEFLQKLINKAISIQTPRAKRKLFLEPANMKVLGFDCLKDSGDYLKYVNDGTLHYNKDYNRTCPEPKGKVIIYVNFEYGDIPFVGIRQDGDSRNVYNGVCETEDFLKQLLNSVR